jgi:hypothetical protein
MVSQKRKPRMAKHQGTELDTRGEAPCLLGGGEGKDGVSVTPVLLLSTVSTAFVHADPSLKHPEKG